MNKEDKEIMDATVFAIIGLILFVALGIGAMVALIVKIWQ